MKTKRLLCTLLSLTFAMGISLTACKNNNGSTDNNQQNNQTYNPSNPDDNPSNPDDKPSNPDDKPSNPDDKPSNPDDKPSNPDDKPSTPDEEEKVTDAKPTVYLAGDSTVQTYSSAQYIAGWGQYLDLFLDDVNVVNCARGGRSSRSFINENRLYDIEGDNYSFSENNRQSIASTIKAGDYLFIQFGHNDDNTKMSSSYDTMPDRMSPIGTANKSYSSTNLPEYAGTRVAKSLLAETYKNGVFPTTAPTQKASTTYLPAEYYTNVTDASKQNKMKEEIAKYGQTYYSYDCGATFKWYLKQYVDLAREKGATPVLITPVARVSYKSDGTTLSDGAGVHGTNWAYVQAVRQLADEEDCPLIDLFADTKELFETTTKTYADYFMAIVPNSVTGTWPTDYDTMIYNAKNGGSFAGGDTAAGNEDPNQATGTAFEKMEATHYNKYGAFWTAAKVAEHILETAEEQFEKGKEYFNFTDNVLTSPKQYYNPSNLISKSKINEVEALVKLINVTDPERTFPDPAEVEAKVNELLVGDPETAVTSENYLDWQQKCDLIRSVYNRLNIDDKSSVPAAALNKVSLWEAAIKANRPKPVRTVLISADHITTGSYEDALSGNAYAFTKDNPSLAEQAEAFSVVAASGKAVEVAANSSSVSVTHNDHQYNFANVFNMKGGASFNASRYIEFTATAKCNVTIVAASTGTEERTVNMVSSSKTSSVLSEFPAGASKATTVTTVENVPADTYRVGSKSSGLWIFAIIIEYYA